jgi:hypothetical protein
VFAIAELAISRIHQPGLQAGLPADYIQPDAPESFGQ